jgi:hypothetical protein
MGCSTDSEQRRVSGFSPAVTDRQTKAANLWLGWPLELSNYPTSALSDYFAYSVARVSRMTVTLI